VAGRRGTLATKRESDRVVSTRVQRIG
jgi:hypothetical protein